MDSTKDDSLELIRTFLPKYLTPDKLDNLFNIVKDNFPYSTDPYKLYSKIEEINFYYQGDSLIDIPFPQFNPKSNTFENSYINAVIISNTCDISHENKRLDTPFIQFASIFSLTDYIEVLRKKNQTQERIDTFIENLKANKITNLFYLPKHKINGTVALEESFIRFDITSSLSVDIFEKETPYNKEYSPIGDRIFSFSDYGFYLFLIKLSIHFCRFKEGVFRS